MIVRSVENMYPYDFVCMFVCMHGKLEIDLLPPPPAAMHDAFT